MRQNLRTMDLLPLDLQFLIQSFLDPSDIVSLRMVKAISLYIKSLTTDLEIDLQIVLFSLSTAHRVACRPAARLYRPRGVYA